MRLGEKRQLGSKVLPLVLFLWSADFRLHSRTDKYSQRLKSSWRSRCVRFVIADHSSSRFLKTDY